MDVLFIAYNIWGQVKRDEARKILGTRGNATIFVFASISFTVTDCYNKVFNLIVVLLKF